MSALLHAALGYAAFGWPVLPVKADNPRCPGGTACKCKAPITARGFQDATRVIPTICAWWQRWPRANVGIATGSPGPDVLDVDVHGDSSGFPAYNRLAHAGLTQGALAVVHTPSGGLHAYYPGTSSPKGKLPRHHLDFQACGGYVLAPPSRVHGRAYELVHRPPGERVAFDWQAAKALLDPPPARPQVFTGQGRIEHLAAFVASQPHGNHNDSLFWAANRAIDDGLDPWPLVEAAIEAGHSEVRARRTVASAVRRRGP